MKRSQLHEISTEIIVGAFIFMILLALGFFTIILSYENIFRQYHPIEVRFDHVRGLRQGDNVFLRGVMIGRVTDLEVEEHGVLVTASLRQPVNMREGYSVRIVASSVLGGQHLALDEGPPDAPVIPSDTVFRGAVPVDLMEEATGAIASVRESLQEGGILENLEATLSDLRSLTEGLAEGRGTIGRLLQEDDLYTDLAAVADDVRHLTGALRDGEGTLGALLTDRQLYDNLLEVSQRLTDGKGTLGRLLAEDDTLYEDLAATLEATREMTEKMAQGEGTIGRLIADDELYDEARMMLHEIRAAIDDFRETAPITTFTSIFFGAF